MHVCDIRRDLRKPDWDRPPVRVMRGDADATVVRAHILDGGEPADLSHAQARFEAVKRLETGRHHQIRVQFASRDLPLFGDRKYGTRAAAAAGPLALCAMSLSFVHPSTGKPMTFSVPPSGGAFSKFKFFQDA